MKQLITDLHVQCNNGSYQMHNFSNNDRQNTTCTLFDLPAPKYSVSATSALCLETINSTRANTVKTSCNIQQY